LRIDEKYVSEVIDDARIGRMRCQYCGQNQEVDISCNKCDKDDYLEPLSNEAKISLDYMKRAKAERAAGGSVEVHPGGLYIAINTSAEEEYFFQGEEADDLEKEYKSFDWMTCDFEDYLLAISQSW